MSFWSKVVDFWTGTERKKVRARDEDGQIIGKIYKLIDFCAINIHRAKEK